MIKVTELEKSFVYKKKELGLKGSLRNFVGGTKETKIAVNNISFEIEAGEIVGFLGPNGAGKTTTLKMLSGIMFPTSGSAHVMGFIPWDGKNEFKRQISIVLGQKNQLWWDLPANESLYLNKCIYGIDDDSYRRTLDELCELLDVKELLDVQVRNLSLGERMKMELVAALLHKPKVIFLDEPTIGLDIFAQKKIRDFLNYYNRQKKITIMLTSHYLEDIEALCRRTIVINHGNIVYDGAIAAVNEKFTNRKIIKIQTLDTVAASPYWEIRTSEAGTTVLEVDKKNTNEIMGALLKKYTIKDFSVENIPLEEGLEKLYTREKN
ncbi:MAG: ABC transporter ATP-binding protein [Treponema sp.]|jgi:ABC-2 type transport system ATP-binding protein|nr:ABC transporter ATP-binding protein [Treponema sp.]